MPLPLTQNKVIDNIWETLGLLRIRVILKCPKVSEHIVARNACICSQAHI